MTSDLKKLEDNRDVLLLAEVAALLHDIGKFCDLHIKRDNNYAYKTIVDDPKSVIKIIKTNVSKKSIEYILSASSPKIADFLTLNVKNALSSKTVTFHCTTYNLAELIIMGRPGTAKRPNYFSDLLGKDSWLPALLGVCHSEAHYDKQDAVKDLYLFSWDKIPGNDNVRLIDFINRHFTIEWVKTAEIEKLDDGRAINVYTGDNNLSLSLNDERTKLYLEIDDGRTCEFIVKKENSTLNIYLIPDIFISTAFGYEYKKVIGLTNRLQSLLIDNPDEYHQIVHSLEENFPYGLGDTRRPINEVTLWDWTISVGSLFKAALAASLLTGIKPAIRPVSKLPLNHDFRWRLLRISYDGFGFIHQAPTITDMLGRKNALETTLNEVKTILEYTYPIGNEIFRDENGSAFVVPALQGDDEKGNKLRSMIESVILDVFRQSELKGEIIPELIMSTPSREARTLHELLSKTPTSVRPFKEDVFGWWYGEQEVVCLACGLRPQGWGVKNIKLKEKAQLRGICHVCLNRREGRAKEWAQDRYLDNKKSAGLWKNTVWIDEVADENHRIALIVGRFDLVEWLNGNMVETMLVSWDPNNSDLNKRFVNKNPSFARLHRVWRTTKEFWEKISENEIPSIIKERHNRLILNVQNVNEIDRELGHYHAYYAEIKNIGFTVVWDSEKKCLITAENLISLSRKMGASNEETPDSFASAEYIRKRLPEQISIYEPGGYGKRQQKICDIKISQSGSNIVNGHYIPFIPLFADPSVFMALVPADRALDVVSKIKDKYEQEMGKVRNRLPLQLGVIYAPHKIPLRVILDSGRRMLKGAFIDAGGWKVSNDPLSKTVLLPDVLKSDKHFTEYVCLELTKNKRRAVWYVPLTMGDGETNDNWYPYVFIQHDKNKNPPSGRKRMFEKPCPWNLDADNKPLPTWLVHVKDIEEHDVIYFTPSTLDFQWLDTSGRRFEIDYDYNGHRLDMLQRPYMLDNLDILQGEIWETLKKYLSTSQIHALYELIETKRYEWEVSDSIVFRNFCCDAIVNSGWGKKKIDFNEAGVYPWGTGNKPPEKEWLELWADYAVHGWLSDVIELNLKVLKRKPDSEREEIV